MSNEIHFSHHISLNTDTDKHNSMLKIFHQNIE